MAKPTNWTTTLLLKARMNDREDNYEIHWTWEGDGQAAKVIQSYIWPAEGVVPIAFVPSQRIPFFCYLRMVKLQCYYSFVNLLNRLLKQRLICVFLVEKNYWKDPLIFKSNIDGSFWFNTGKLSQRSFNRCLENETIVDSSVPSCQAITVQKSPVFIVLIWAVKRQCIRQQQHFIWVVVKTLQ